MAVVYFKGIRRAKYMLNSHVNYPSRPPKKKHAQQENTASMGWSTASPTYYHMSIVTQLNYTTVTKIFVYFVTQMIIKSF
jgi:hypothetical protein